jgi:hypothetical protein
MNESIFLWSYFCATTTSIHINGKGIYLFIYSINGMRKKKSYVGVRGRALLLFIHVDVPCILC